MTFNQNQFRDAGKRSIVDLSLPTDKELSHYFATTIVTAFPEDFPGFSPDIQIEHTSLDERISCLKECLTNRLAFWNPNTANDKWQKIAFTRSGLLETFYSKISYEAEPRLNGFLILKHSQLVSPEQDIANAAKVDTTSITSPLTWEELAFLSSHHEQTHIAQTFKKEFQDSDFRSEFRAEWGADSSSLYAYIVRQPDVSEQNRVINAVIAGRAVAGFLSQPDKYWIAPLLKDTFDRPKSRDGNFSASIDPAEIWIAYTELRLRTIMFLQGYTSVNSYDPIKIRNAIIEFDQNISHETRDKILKDGLANLKDNFGSANFDKHRRSGAALQVLAHITDHANLAPFTRACGQQIIDGAKLICPSLLVSNYPKNDPNPTQRFG